MTENRRQDDRLPVMWKATIIDEFDHQWPASVRDVSTAGALLSCDQSFDMDTDLLVQIDTLGEFAGRVKWRGNGEIGLMLIVGNDLMLKKFADTSGPKISDHPSSPDDFC